MKHFIFLSFLFCGIFSSAFGDDIEQRAQVLDKKLIAPCCWTKTLDQEQSREAYEMKDEIREKLSQGQTEQQILDAFEKKFGERILAEPKAAGFNWAVWILPFLALLGGLIFLIRMLQKFKTPEITSTETPLQSSPALSEQDEKYRKIIDEELYR